MVKSGKIDIVRVIKFFEQMRDAVIIRKFEAKGASMVELWLLTMIPDISLVKYIGAEQIPGNYKSTC